MVLQQNGFFEISTLNDLVVTALKQVRIIIFIQNQDDLRRSLHESGLSFNPERHFVFTWEIELMIERSRRMKISFRIEIRFRFMYQ